MISPRHPSGSPSARFSQRSCYAIIAILVIVYAALTIASALTKRPWSDEGWFASPAYNLLNKGFMGTTVIESANLWFRGIDRYTYWILPLHILAQAAWYKIAGFGLFQMRMLSVLCGALALLSWYVIVVKLTRDRAAALLTLALLSTDYILITGGSFGRYDMMAAALGFAGMAAYLGLRERRFTLAVLAGHSLVAASAFTHFNGILAFAALLFLMLYFDRRRVRLPLLALAVVPYLIGTAGWGLYILQDPSLFWSQLRGNAMASNRMATIASPWLAVKMEILSRYAVAFGLGEHSTGHSGPIQLKILILAAYIVGIAGTLLAGDLRRKTGPRVLLFLTAIYVGILAIIDGQKLSWYLVYLVPFYTALLAVWIVWALRRRLLPRWLAAAGVLGLVALQTGGVLYRIHLDDYHRRYLPAAEFLRQHRTGSDLVMASAELAFQLGFDDHVLDDPFLGYNSGKKPAFIVVEEIYQGDFRGNRASRPEVYRHITQVLQDEYRLLYDRASYRIYGRK